MKKNYQHPEIKIIEIESQPVLLTGSMEGGEEVPGGVYPD